MPSANVIEKPHVVEMTCTHWLAHMLRGYHIKTGIQWLK